MRHLKIKHRYRTTDQICYQKSPSKLMIVAFFLLKSVMEIQQYIKHFTQNLKTFSIKKMKNKRL